MAYHVTAPKNGIIMMLSLPRSHFPRCTMVYRGYLTPAQRTHLATLKWDDAR